jgi:hypothetical protein
MPSKRESSKRELITPRRGAVPEYRRITLYFTEDLIRRVKHAAIDARTDASTLVRTAVEAYLGPEKPTRA